MKKQASIAEAIDTSFAFIIQAFQLVTSRLRLHCMLPS